MTARVTCGRTLDRDSAEFVTEGAVETERLAAQLAARLRPGDVVLLYGDLGSGKTVFVRGACRALGVEGPVTSPTFTIGSLHQGTVEVAHLDLYRLNDVGDLTDIADDYLTADRIGFVEWPERGGARFAPGAVLAVTLTHGGGDRRVVETSWLVADRAGGENR